MTLDLRDHSPAVLPITTPSVSITAPRHGGRRRDRREPILLGLIALSALGAALMSSASPAGVGLADALYRGVFAGSMVWFAARARRWTWPILAGLAAVSTGSLVAQIGAIAALAFGVHAAVGRARRNPLRGAAIATVCMPALLLQGPGPLWRVTGGAVTDPFALSALITVLATAPVVGSGWKTLSRRRRRTLRRQGRRVAMLVGGVTAITLAISALALPPSLQGLELSRAAAQAAHDGDLIAATAAFEEAAEHWATANSIVAAPWMIPGRLLPIVGQHVRAGQVVTGQAAAVMQSAAQVTARVDPDAMIVSGTVNIDEIDQITPAVDALAATTARADTKISAVRSPWLLWPVSKRLDRGIEVLGRSSGLVGASAEALHVGADLLGRETTSRFLVMLSTPAEARGSGGFVGNWALLESDAGSLSLVEQYHSRELNALLEAANAELVADEDYTTRYGRFEVDRHIQDVTLSPHFPSVAPVAADLFAQATGVRVDAVMMIDPFVIEKLVGFTGPLDAGGEIRLDGAHAAHELLVEQYERFDADERGRETALLGLTTTLMDLLIADPPDPLSFLTELAPLAEQGRLSLWLAEDHDGSIVERLGVSGAFPTSEDGLLALVHQNAGQNKIDPYLDRTVDIRTTLDRAAGEVSHQVTITLSNNAPESGLPEAVLGSNDQGLAPGTNRMLLSIHSSDRIRSATIDGATAAVEEAREFGQPVYTVLLTIPADDFVVIELDLVGQMQSMSEYSMTLGAQPLSAPDQVSWKISTTDLSRLRAPSGWSIQADGARWSAPLDRPATMTFDLGD